MSRRTQPLPNNWATIRRRILNRDGNRCTATRNDGTRCPAPATDVDHITPASQGGTDDDTNLAALCKWHHDRKTGREANAARPRLAPRNRPAEQHPGMVVG